MCDCDYILSTNADFEEHYDNCSSVWAERHRDIEIAKNDDGTLRLNKNLQKLESDVLYHLGFDTYNYDLQLMFGDIKFVCMGGTKHRMKEFARYMSELLKLKDVSLVNLSKHSHRYAMYKVGPVLSVSHGIGIPSMTILLQEIIKLLYYAKAKNPIIFRIGTSGGLNISPGSVVISSWGLSGGLKRSYDVWILGNLVSFPSWFDKRLSQEILSLATPTDGFNTYIGGTMAADDFYRGQGRTDGPFCAHDESQKLSFLKKLVDLGVKNIEMEATAFAALCWEAGVRAADVCVTILNRLDGDQVTMTKETFLKWQKRPMTVVGRYIANYYYNNCI